MAQKYIVNDIVMYKNKIHTIIDILASNGYELSYVRHQVSPVRLSGVPLTPEILEKNGWKENRYTDMFYKAIGEGRYLNLRVEGQQTWIVGLAHQDLLKNIKYVHQLQHLLFGLGFNSEMEV